MTALGVIAGGGQLPRAIAQSATAAGRKVHVLAVKGSADEAWLAEFSHDWMTLGEWGRAVKLFADAGVKQFVMVGRVDRPTLSEIKFDTKGLMILPSLVAAARKGDGAMLRSNVEQSSVAPEKSDVVGDIREPIVRQASLKGESYLAPGKSQPLGSLDIPGSTSHLQIEVVMDPLP